MKVEIVNINYEKPEILGKRAPFFEAQIRCKMFAGSVFLYTQFKYLESGTIIYVETGHEFIRDIEIIKDKCKAEIFHLEDPFAYSVTGQVIQTFHDVAFQLVVGDMLIELDNNDTLGKLLAIGDWVKFKLYGLSLWDINF
jgi:hypothetical protein